MHREAAQAADAVRAQLALNRDCIEQAAQALRSLGLKAVVTCARGSSDHAATFAKYLIETRTGVLTSSAAPSVSSVYAAPQSLSGTVFIAISQSGASPDLLAAADSAKKAGAYVLALVNAESSPLAQRAHLTIPLRAGPEKSVAATKSYIASLAALTHLVATWTRDQDLLRALASAPQQLEDAWQCDWSEALPQLRAAQHLYVIGRGLGLGMAQEVALKLKETCGLHAEAFSAAEVRHGPMALIREGFPVLMLSQNDETRHGMEALADELIKRGASLILAGAHHAGALNLRTVSSHPVIEPMLMTQSFYRMVNRLALERGRDPDRPPHLAKVTETV
ncbi:MAG TPA: SIS domain-containing protein [Steroidobacteraceae bacterium]